MGNKVITTVCDVLIRDPLTHAGIYRGKTSSTTAFNVAMKNTDVRGGRNNPLIMKYMHTRDLDITIDSVTTNKNIIAMNLGNDVTNGQYNVLGTDCMVLDSSGNGTLTNTPIGNVDVLLPDGTLVNVTPTVKTITVLAAAGERVEANYVYSSAVDRVAIGTTTPPKTVELYMTGEVRDSSTNNIVEYMQFYIPAFQISGNYKLDFKSDGTSTESLTGNALSVTGTDCQSGDTYGYVYWIPNTSSVYTYTAIAVTPNTFAPTHGVASTQQLSVYGIRGTALPATNVTASATFAKVTGGATTITVSTGGLISVSGTSVANDTATVTATFVNGTNTFTDTCVVTVA